MKPYITFFLINFLILGISYLLASSFKIKNLSCKCLVTGLIGSSQIIFSELFLGVIGKLFLPTLIGLNGIICALLLFWAYCRAGKKTEFFVETLRHDALKGSCFLRESRTPFLTVFFVLFLFVSFWIMSAAYSYPPRDVDGLVYHLSPLFQAVQTGRLSILPLDLRYHFAFPFNADLLFLWPAIFFHSQQFVDCVQLFYAFLGMVAVYALARMLGQTQKISLWMGFLYFFTPVVLFQSGSNLIEVIISAFYLMAIYFAIRFYREKNSLLLYLAGFAMGLTIGMKYYMPLFVISLQFIVFKRFSSLSRKRVFVYFLLMFAVGGYWYLRNYLVLGSPTYPADIFKLKGDGAAFVIHPKTFSLTQYMLGIFQNAYQLIIKDKSLGTFQGGYGLAFWGLAFPSWAYLFYRSLKRPRQPEEITLWVQVILGILFILPIVPEQFEFSIRFTLFICAIGYLALGQVVMSLHEGALMTKTIRMLSMISAIFAISLMSNSLWPIFRIDDALKDRLENRDVSAYHYLSHGTWYLGYLAVFWEFVDYITKDAPKGLSCYISSSWQPFWTAPFYGSKLQNTIYNFQKNFRNKPDICFFSYLEPGKIYIGKKITLRDIAFDSNYLLIARAPQCFLFISKDSLGQDHRKTKLLKLYERLLDKKAVKNIQNTIPEGRFGIPLIISGSKGHALRYLQLKRFLKHPLWWVPEGLEGELVKTKGIKEYYLFDKKNQKFEYIH